MLRELDNGEVIHPYFESDIRAEFPNTCFPIDTATGLTDYSTIGVFRELHGVVPDYNPITHCIMQDTPVKDENGQWHQAWKVEPHSQETMATIIKEMGDTLKSSTIEFVTDRLNSFANTRGYDSVDSMAKYKDITDEEIASSPADEQALIRKFRTECRYLAFITARTWAKLYLVLSDVETGVLPVPSSPEDLVPYLPVMEWPA